MILFSVSNTSKRRLKQRQASITGNIVGIFIEDNPDDLRKTKLRLEEMTGVIDQLITYGRDRIYEETYEHLLNHLNNAQSSK